jgi:hypothetical protein
MMDTPASTPRYQRPDEDWERGLLAGVSTAVGDTHGERQDHNQTVGDVVAKMAAMTARRRCNRHGCTIPTTGVCEHPDARLDADYLRHILDVLGLPGDFQPVTEDDRVNLLSSLAQREEIGPGHYGDDVED